MGDIMEITIGEKKYRVEQALEYLAASGIEYMKEVNNEMRKATPDMKKADVLTEMAHNNVIVLEDIIIQALSQGLRVEEESLRVVRSLHDNIHKLMQAISLGRMAEVISDRGPRAKTLKPEDMKGMN